MALNFPSSPSDGDTFLGGNGINYVYVADDGSWQVFSDPALAGTQVWSRRPGSAELIPVYNGDSVVVTTSAGADAVTITDDGNVTASGKFIGDVDIESYPTLP